MKSEVFVQTFDCYFFKSFFFTELCQTLLFCNGSCSKQSQKPFLPEASLRADRTIANRLPKVGQCPNSDYFVDGCDQTDWFYTKIHVEQCAVECSVFFSTAMGLHKWNKQHRLILMSLGSEMSPWCSTEMSRPANCN